jgi:hypothetical protein
VLILNGLEQRLNGRLAHRFSAISRGESMEQDAAQRLDSPQEFREIFRKTLENFAERREFERKQDAMLPA